MPSPVPFRKVRKQLEDAGWQLDRVTGSHHIFVKLSHRNIIVPVHRNKVKWVYARQIEKELEEEGREG